MICSKTKPGWYCTRNEGHEGPCAAVPMGNISYQQEFVTDVNTIRYNASYKDSIEIHQSFKVQGKTVNVYLGDICKVEGSYIFYHSSAAEFNLKTDHLDVAKKRALSCSLRLNRRLSKALAPQISRQERQEEHFIWVG